MASADTCSHVKGKTFNLNWDATAPDASASLHARPSSVDHPPHYRSGGMEAIDVIEAFGLGFNLGNVAKYVLRAGRKADALEDLMKARWYLDREVARLEDAARVAGWREWAVEGGS